RLHRLQIEVGDRHAPREADAAHWIERPVDWPIAGRVGRAIGIDGNEWPAAEQVELVQQYTFGRVDRRPRELRMLRTRALDACLACARWTLASLTPAYSRCSDWRRVIHTAQPVAASRNSSAHWRGGGAGTGGATTARKRFR